MRGREGPSDYEPLEYDIRIRKALGVGRGETHCAGDARRQNHQYESERHGPQVWPEICVGAHDWRVIMGIDIPICRLKSLTLHLRDYCRPRFASGSNRACCGACPEREIETSMRRSDLADISP